MRTTIYFIRHAKSDFAIRDEHTRPLTPEGTKSASGLIETFANIRIDKIYSSPFIRSMKTVEPLAKQRGIAIDVVEDFRERHIGEWVDDFEAFARKQWQDFNYSLDGGETLGEVQHRNRKALNEIIADDKGRSIVIGTHGTSLSTILNSYDSQFGYDSFNAIAAVMPLVVKTDFAGENCLNYTFLNLQQ